MKRTTAPALLGLACLLVMPAIAHARYRDGMNLYEYVRANPTGLLDPSGLAVTNDSLESGLGGDGWARSPRCLPSRPATPKEIAVGHLLASVDSRYVYSKATGLGEMIRGKLVPALRGVSWVTLDPDYKEPTYHYTSNEITLLNYNAISILHEAVHAYQDKVNMYDDLAKTDERAEGMAYAVQYQVVALRQWFRPIEDTLNGAGKASDAAEALRSQWANAWMHMTYLANSDVWIDQGGKRVYYRDGATKKVRRVQWRDLRSAKEKLGFTVSCDELRDAYNRLAREKEICITFYCEVGPGDAGARPRRPIPEILRRSGREKAKAP